MNDLYNISYPLDKKLMQTRRNTRIGVDPITTKNKVLAAFHIGNEERSGQSLAPDGQLDVSNTSGRNRRTSSHASDGHIGSDQLFIFAPELLEQRVWHEIDDRPAVH